MGAMAAGTRVGAVPQIGARGTARRGQSPPQPLVGHPPPAPPLVRALASTWYAGVQKIFISAILVSS